MIIVLFIYSVSYLLIGDFMNFLKNFGKSFSYSIGILLILTIILTILSYFNVLGVNLVNIFKIINLCLATMIGGFVTGKNSSNKGWLEGLKFGILFVIIVLLFNLLGIGSAFGLLNIVSYVIIITTSIIGSMIGISLKIEENS